MTTGLKTSIKTIHELMQQGEPYLLAPEWEVRAVCSEQCLSFVVWNTQTHEAIIVDPKREDMTAYLQLASELKKYRYVAILDTHTHADHVSIGAELAESLHCSYVMHVLSPTHRPNLKVTQDAKIYAQAGSIRCLHTPGHTQDSMTILWGPFVLGGDTVLYGDSGRDDLPTGDARAHFQSLQKLKSILAPDSILLPGHDHRGGRASTWQTQLRMNASLKQSEAEFVEESLSFLAPAPQNLNESLRENFK